jgi:N-dimethylarginine dimethylaminohydrolase
VSNKHRYLTRRLVVEAFHDQDLLKDIWGHGWGADNEVGRIRMLLMHRPGQEVLQLHEHASVLEQGPVLSGEIAGTKPSTSQQSDLPRLELLQAQHDALADVLRKEGIDVVALDEPPTDETTLWPERLFTRDLGMVIPGGVIASRFALYIRYGESRLAMQAFSRIGIPILGTIQGTGFSEGGSFTMLDAKTAVIGRSERINMEGIEQLKQLLAIQQIRLMIIELPSTIIHLDEAFLMVDRDKALVHTALLPFWFLDELHQRNIEILHVHPSDPPLTINALTVAPGRVVFSKTGVRTMELLDRNGIEVIPVDVSEIFKLGGGIHCVTLPLIRDRLD